MKATMCSDVDGDLSQVLDLDNREALILLGDNISKQSYMRGSVAGLIAETKRVAKEAKEQFDHVLWLDGNVDLRPDFTELVLKDLGIISLAEKISGGIYTSRLVRKIGDSVLERPILSFGSGASIGGLEQFKTEETVFNKWLKDLEIEESGVEELFTRIGYLPSSSLSMGQEGLNPVYSGKLFFETSSRLIKEIPSTKEVVIVNHNPPFMGLMIGYEQTPKQDLDLITCSNVQGFSQIKHVGCTYLRMFTNWLNDTGNGDKAEIYCGHIEERGGYEGIIGQTSVYNVAEHPRVIDV
ncbi:MAG: hypothetical protein GOU97_04070 [Nanoarchaeota archaeon]|nr:hypothetical protein [Nanoarchaeota archaeon]